MRGYRNLAAAYYGGENHLGELDVNPVSGSSAPNSQTILFYRGLDGKRSSRIYEIGGQIANGLRTFDYYDPVTGQLLYELNDYGAEPSTGTGHAIVINDAFCYGPAGLVQEWGVYGNGEGFNPTKGAASGYVLDFAFDPSGNLVSSAISQPTIENSQEQIVANNLPLNVAEYDAYGMRLCDLYTYYSTPDTSAYSAVSGATPGALQVGFAGKWGCFEDLSLKVTANNQDPRLGNYDNPGMVICGARLYDSVTARWLTRDPIGYDGGINVYAYCDGNPVMNADPSGLDALFIIGRNHRNPSFMRGHAEKYLQEYEASNPGKHGHIVDAETTADFIAAVNNATYSIDHFEYVGHSSENSAKLLLGDDDKKAWITAADVQLLSTKHFTTDAYIRLTGCHTVESKFGSKSIAHAFAAHFNRPVEGFDGGLSFGFPFPPGQSKDETPWFILDPHIMRGIPALALPNGGRMLWEQHGHGIGRGPVAIGGSWRQ